MNPFSAVALVAERKILEAQAEGVFDNLPGLGKPLSLGDDAHILPEWRMARKILQNSGYLGVQSGKRPAGGLTRPDSSEAFAAQTALRRFSFIMGKVRHRQGRAEDLSQELILRESPYFMRLLQRTCSFFGRENRA